MIGAIKGKMSALYSSAINKFKAFKKDPKGALVSLANAIKFKSGALYADVVGGIKSTVGVKNNPDNMSKHIAGYMDGKLKTFVNKHVNKHASKSKTMHGVVGLPKLATDSAKEVLSTIKGSGKMVLTENKHKSRPLHGSHVYDEMVNYEKAKLQFKSNDRMPANVTTPPVEKGDNQYVYLMEEVVRLLSVIAKETTTRRSISGSFSQSIPDFRGSNRSSKPIGRFPTTINQPLAVQS